MRFPMIEAERIKHRMSRDELANVLGVTKRTVSNWQSGATEIPFSKLSVLTQKWNCTAEYLLGQEMAWEGETKERRMDKHETYDFVDICRKQNEAARRIVALSGELRLSFEDLEEALNIIKRRARLAWED